MAYQDSVNCPPVLIKASDFDQWLIPFIDFISRRENGDYMIKSFTEGPLIIYKREEDFTEEEIKRKKADRDALSNLKFAISKLPHTFHSRIEYFKHNPMFLWNEITKILHGSKVEFKVIEEKKDEIEDSEKIMELTKRLEEVKELLILEREDHKKEKEGLVQRISDLEIDLKMKEKESEDKKAFELQFQRLSKQNSDFQKVLFLEKQKLEKERADFEDQRKGFETKNAKLTEKISELQEELDLEREELEKRKKAEFQARSVKDDYSVERKIFQQEIQKLTKNLAVLSTDIMKEKRVNCDIRKKLELMTKERNALKDKVRSFNNSECFSECPMRPSNIFYEHSVDKSSKYYADLPSYKRVNMKWKVKGKFPEKDVPKSSFPNKNFKTKVNSFVNSYCGNYDFVNNNSVQYWYGTYHFPSYRAPLNVSGPKTRWVPKST